MNKNVEHPTHYKVNNLECIDAMEELFGKEQTQDFCLLNAFKYIWRCENKENKVQDIEKAKWYLQKYLDIEQKK